MLGSACKNACKRLKILHVYKCQCRFISCNVISNFAPPIVVLLIIPSAQSLRNKLLILYSRCLSSNWSGSTSHNKRTISGFVSEPWSFRESRSNASHFLSSSPLCFEFGSKRWWRILWKVKWHSCFSSLTPAALCMLHSALMGVGWIIQPRNSAVLSHRYELYPSSDIIN